MATLNITGPLPPVLSPAACTTEQFYVPPNGTMPNGETTLTGACIDSPPPGHTYVVVSQPPPLSLGLPLLLIGGVLVLMMIGGGK